MRATNTTTSNDALPVSLNELWGEDGDDLLESTISSPNNGISTLTNHLDGGRGDDSLTATSSASGGTVQAKNLLDGGDGQDTLTADLSGEAIRSGLSAAVVSNQLNGGRDDDRLVASLALTSRSVAGFQADNHLEGGSGDDVLEATISVVDQSFPNNPENSHAENHLQGGIGNDVLTATVEAGTTGASFLSGGAGNDRLTVFGGIGNRLDGGAGRDTLVGGTGDDDMIGGNGPDTFVFAPTTGHDTIGDFQGGPDKIDLRAFAAEDIDSFADLNIAAADGNSVIRFDDANDITVLGVTELQASDFLLA